MPSLRELQRAFSAAVFNELPAELAQYIRAGRFPGPRHFQIYRNNVCESLTNALKAVYPVVERLVGDGFFRYAADTFLRTHPLSSGNLHDFGGGFAEFLENFPPSQELVYLPDVARLEWAWHRSFHAADRAPLALNALAAIAPAQYADLKFILHPSAQLITSDYPVLRIWEVNQLSYAGDQSIELSWGGVKLLVIRRQEVQIEALNEADYALLSACAVGATLAQAAEAALRIQPDYDLILALHRHARSGVFSDFSC